RSRASPKPLTTRAGCGWTPESRRSPSPPATSPRYAPAVSAVSYPDTVLADDEQVVLHRHPHWKRLIGAVLVLLVATALAAFAGGFISTRVWDPSAKNIIAAVIWGIWLLIV